jgi:hypothetical protein
MTPNDTMSPRPLDDYKPPKLGWCEDVVVLQRRTIVRVDAVFNLSKILGN